MTTLPSESSAPALTVGGLFSKMVTTIVSGEDIVSPSLTVNTTSYAVASSLSGAVKVGFSILSLSNMRALGESHIKIKSSVKSSSTSGERVTVVPWSTSIESRATVGGSFAFPLTMTSSGSESKFPSLTTREKAYETNSTLPVTGKKNSGFGMVESDRTIPSGAAQ